MQTDADLTDEFLSQLSNLDSSPSRVQAHIAIIDKWLAAQDARLIAGDPYKRHVRLAVKMVQAGINSNDVERYVKHLKGQAFWRDKLIGLEYVADHIEVWLKARSNNNHGTSTYSYIRTRNQRNDEDADQTPESGDETQYFGRASADV